MTRKLFWIIALLLAASAALYWFTRPPPRLTVMTWAGAYSRAQSNAMMRPYAAQTSSDVLGALWDGDLAELEKAVDRHVYPGDVIDLELPEAVEACRRGLLEKLDAAMLPPGLDGAPAAQDFVPGAIGPCWIGSVVYSQVMVFAPGMGRLPHSLADFFDTQNFPGRRALNRAMPKFNLEMALLADGVAPGDVYRTLDTKAGLDRAFAKLKALNPIWAHDSQDALNWVKNGQAVMATALNGDVDDAARKGFAPGVIWDHQLYEMDVFAIPAGDSNARRARDFIAFATGSAPLAAMADWVPYGPARRSAIALVKTNPEFGTPMRPLLSTAPENFRHAFAVDDAWWLSHQIALANRWQAFVENAP